MREGLAKLESTSAQISNKMAEIARLERQFRDMVNNLKYELIKDVQNVQLPGITVSESPTSTFAVVRRSDFSRQSWSPRYYLPQEQAKAVVSALENCTTVDDICKKIGKMFMKGYIGDRTDDRIYLNNFTLDAIRNSDIGIYVMANNYAKKKSKPH